MRRAWSATTLCLALVLLVASGTMAKTTIRFWTSHVNPDITKWYDEELIPAFEAAHPDIEVEWLSLTWEERHEKIMTAFASGTAPDVIASGTEQIYDEVLSGMALPLDSFVEAWGEYDEYFPVAWENQTIGGHIYRVPTLLSARGIMYNKGHFRDIGLDPEKPPETWEYLAEAARKLTVREGKRTVRLGADLWAIHNFNQGFTYFLAQNGGKLISEDFRKAAFDGPEGLETANFMIELYKELQPVGTAALTTTGNIPFFPTEKISITVAIPQDVRNIENYAPDGFEAGFALPGRKQKAIQVYGNGIYITTQSKHPNEAWKLISFMMNEENQAKLNNYLFSINPRKSATDDPFVTSKPLLRAWYEPLMDYGVLFPILPEHARLHRALREEMEAACYNQKSPEQAIKDAANTWNGLLAEAEASGGLLTR